jgi:uncharacterized Fe-S cluster-containing MiaB family protein
MGEKWPRNFAESGDFHVTFGLVQYDARIKDKNINNGKTFAVYVRLARYVY